MAVGTQAEQAMLAAALVDPGCVLGIDMAPECFTQPGDRALFAAIQARVTAGQPADPALLADELRDKPAAFQALMDAAAGTGSPANAAAYADRVRQDYLRRRLATELQTAAAAVGDAETDPAEHVAELMQRLADLTSGSDGHTFAPSELMDCARGAIAAAREAHRNGRPRGVPYGIRALDNVLGGMMPGHLIVVGARPKMGKTAFSITVALNAANRGARVGIASAEMSAEQMGLRMVSAASAIPNDALLRGDLDDRLAARADAAAERVAALPIFLTDLPGMTVGAVVRQARAWRDRHGLDLLLVDYLGRLRADRERERQDLTVGEMASSLKTLARNLEIPVVLLAQLSRGVEHRPNKRPTPADFRDSGVIEQEADQILMLYRETVYDKNAPPDRAEVLIPANRHGPVGLVDLRFVGHRMLWCDLDMHAYDAGEIL